MRHHRYRLIDYRKHFGCIMSACLVAAAVTSARAQDQSASTLMITGYGSDIVRLFSDSARSDSNPIEIASANMPVNIPVMGHENGQMLLIEYQGQLYWIEARRAFFNFEIGPCLAAGTSMADGASAVAGASAVQCPQ